MDKYTVEIIFPDGTSYITKSFDPKICHAESPMRNMAHVATISVRREDADCPASISYHEIHIPVLKEHSQGASESEENNDDSG